MNLPTLTSASTPSQTPAQLPTYTRVLLVDEHELLRKGIRYALQESDCVETVGEAGTRDEALRLCDEVHPDVVLMDLGMPENGGVEAIRALRAAHPEVQVVALSSLQEGELVLTVLEAGAIGFLLMDVAVAELVHAIRLAHRGQPSLAPGAAQSLVHLVASPPPRIGHDLTEREREVLTLVAKGISNPQIAEELVVSVATVKFHLRSIRSKLGTASRTATVVLALQQHLVPMN
jgi:two-component system, NarL family, response regulator LiaR